MHCIRCGRESQAGASFCWHCGAALAPTAGAPPAGVTETPPPPTGGAEPTAGWRPFDPTNPPAVPTASAGEAPAAAPAPGQWARPFNPAPAEAVAAGEPRPGGFWRRAFASIIDGFLLNVLNMPFALMWVWPHYETLTASDISPEQFAALMSGYLLAGTTGFLISWLYHAGLESSVAQATLGKMALGVKVCDRELRRIGFGHATGRFFSKLVSNLTFGIGYLMAAFTSRKRALHDMIAGTRVIRG